MIIRFGLDFDGMLPAENETRLGFVVAGPSLFLSILETQLGIIPELSSEGTRVVQYRSCLQEKDSPSRFYHRSFDIDELGVAKALLRWRDAWYLAGWKGVFDGSVGRRLGDMAEAETVAREKVGANFGQRLLTVIETLGMRKTQIEKIELVDPLEHYPLLWQKVLGFFATQDLSVDLRKPCAAKGTDLYRLQKVLLDTAQERQDEACQIAFSGDGTVIVLRAGSRAASARLVAEYLNKHSKSETAILTGSHGFSFDEAAEALDLPKCGFQPLSTWRPPMQILPLALGHLWQPLNPEILSQFLNLPIAPLPKRVRGKLAPVVVNYPGIGGPEWNRTVADILKSEMKERGVDKEKVDELAADIQYWLSPERFDAEDGAKTTLIAERCKRVADYLAARVGTAQDPSAQFLFAAAHRQAADLSEAVDRLVEQGKETISRQQLERLMVFSAGIGAPLTDRLSEVGHFKAGESTAVFIEPADEVVWWDLSMPDLPTLPSWTREEIETLIRQGVQLPPVDRELDRLATTWRRPILSAKKRLVLVLHESDEADHPVWDQIRTCCAGWVEIDVETFLHSGEPLPGLCIRTQPLASTPLPPLRRWWRLPEENAGLLEKRSKESYSSLDNFINSPYQWVLGHKAKLYAGGFEPLASGNQLKGSLVHRLFERFFGENGNWSKLTKAQIHTWVGKSLSPLLSEEGASLLMPGRAAEKEVLLEVAQRALFALVNHLKNARVQNVLVEHYEQATFKGGDLGGYIDLLLSDKSGNEMVVDVKWGGLKYRSEDLRKNRHLQLAVYAYLRKKSENLPHWPKAAYFIINEARMIAQDQSVFPDAIVADTDTEEGIRHLWKRFEKTWQWRRKQLDEGHIEITVTGTEPTAESEPPEEGLVIDPHNDTFNDYWILTGWGADR